MLLWSTGLLAQTTSPLCAVVETTNGERMEYLLSDQPRIVHNDATVTLTTTKTTVEFSAKEISKVYLSSPNTAIRESKVNNSAIHMVGNQVRFSGLGASEAVSLYSTDGRLMLSQKADTNGSLTLSLSQLNTGIYIIKTNQQSIKITKK